MDKKEIPMVNPGLALMILIMMNLCLLTFSVLSLENAVADRRMSAKAAEHTTKYYEVFRGTAAKRTETRGRSETE